MRVAFFAQRYQGYVTAQFNLGCCYRDGTGVEQDAERAFELFQQAADAGDEDAECSLGVAYERGEGVAQSDELAKQWYAKAATAGHKLAKSNLAVLHARSTRAQSWLQNIAAAIRASRSASPTRSICMLASSQAPGRR